MQTPLYFTSFRAADHLQTSWYAREFLYESTVYVFELTHTLQPVRMSSAGSGYASLTGTGVPAQFYFYQGRLTIYDPNNNTLPYLPLINSFQNNVASCDTFGALVFVQGGSTNKCAKYSSFQIQSNGQNSQLGAELVFNYVGGFYSCSSGQEVRELL